MLKARFVIASLALAMIFFPAASLIAQSAPLPSQIPGAKKVFISNTGVGFDSSAWSGGPDRIYNEFYADVKSSGQYQLVGAPSDADLALDVNVVRDPVVWQFKLDLIDPKTRIVLWTLYEPIQVTVTQKTRDKNFDNTISKLVSDLNALTAQTAAAAK
ncbi:MAG: hypothetical protein ABSE46_12010 [Terracidiphilus sp.]